MPMRHRLQRHKNTITLFVEDRKESHMRGCTLWGGRLDGFFHSLMRYVLWSPVFSSLFYNTHR